MFSCWLSQEDVNVWEGRQGSYYRFVTDLVIDTETSSSKLCRPLLGFRSVAGVDVDPDLVHMEIQDSSGGALPLALHYSLLFTLV